MGLPGETILKELFPRDFLDGPVVKNPPCSAGDEGLIPGVGRPQMVARVLPTPEPVSSRAGAPQLRVHGKEFKVFFCSCVFWFRRCSGVLQM